MKKKYCSFSLNPEIARWTQRDPFRLSAFLIVPLLQVEANEKAVLFPLELGEGGSESRQAESPRCHKWLVTAEHTEGISGEHLKERKWWHRTVWFGFRAAICSCDSHLIKGFPDFISETCLGVWWTWRSLVPVERREIKGSENVIIVFPQEEPRCDTLL